MNPGRNHHPQDRIPKASPAGLAGSPASGPSPASRSNTATLEDLELLLAQNLASPEPLSLEETSERDESGSTASDVDMSKRLEPWMAELQAKVASLRAHKVRCEHATRSLLQELLRIRAQVQLQGSELRQLRREVQCRAQAPEKETQEFPGAQNQNQMQILDRSCPARGATPVPGPARGGQGPALGGDRGHTSALEAAGSALAGSRGGFLCTRLMEVRESLAQIRRRQELQDAERKGTEQDADLRLAKLTSLLKQEEQGREAACSALQKSQEDASQKVDHEVAKMQAQLTRLGEEVSLRFLKREARLCGFLQKSFLALEQRMKASERARLKVEGSMRQELENRWRALQELAEERVRVLRAQREVGAAGWWVPQAGTGTHRFSGCLPQQEESHLQEQCQGLDAAVAQLTKVVQQNQMSLRRILLVEQKAWCVSRELSVSWPTQSPTPTLTAEVTLGRNYIIHPLLYSPKRRAGNPTAGLDKSRAGELAACAQENLEAVRAASRLARRELQSVLELHQEKSQVLEGSVAEVARQVKDLGEHCLALGWRLDLQEQTLGLRLSEAKMEWEGVERKSQEDTARWRKEFTAHLQEVREKVDSLPRQIEGVSDRCILHKSDSDLKISSEGKAREFQVMAVRQELASLLSSVQLLKEDSPGRKVAEIQGSLATFQKQIIKLENSIQANKTIQNLKFNTETKLRAEEMATLRESMLRLWSEEGPWPLTLGSRRVFMSLVRQRFFIKDVAPGEQVPVNCWGVYQALRWLQWKAVLMKRPRDQAAAFADVIRQPPPILPSRVMHAPVIGLALWPAVGPFQVAPLTSAAGLAAREWLPKRWHEPVIGAPELWLSLVALLLWTQL
ncbi:coiled-coil domain-containing protein 154 [Ctenodactylus gundi]